MIVRFEVFVLALFVSHKLEAAIGDDLVHVHVRRCARAALKNIELELVVELSVENLLTGAFDRRQNFLGYTAWLEIGSRDGDVHKRINSDEVRVVLEPNARS